MREECVVCGGRGLYKVLDLGVVPSSNNLVPKAQLDSVKRYPLVYYMCRDCGMFQLLDIASSEDLFGNYLYFTGANKELVAHFRELASDLAKEAKARDLAVVVGSNDGTEVNQLKEAGFKTAVGVEPARNVAEAARANGAETVNDFFGLALSDTIVGKYGKADIVSANNVFAHIPDPRDMLLGMKNLIKPDGTIVIEVHWLKSIVEQLEIETLYTEHYYVWSVKAMERLVRQCGLHIGRVLHMPNQHGGSLRFYLRPDGGDDLALMKDEEEAGLYSEKAMGALQARADERKGRLLRLIGSLKKDGKRVSIWSVPAKVPTLLNFCGITSKEIDCAYEIVPSKIGRYIPMAEIEIKDESEIRKDMPDYLIIGAWNYLDLAKRKLGWYLDAGGRLINPLTDEVISR